MEDSYWDEFRKARALALSGGLGSSEGFRQLRDKFGITSSDLVRAGAEADFYGRIRIDGEHFDRMKRALDFLYDERKRDIERVQKEEVERVLFEIARDPLAASSIAKLNYYRGRLGLPYWEPDSK